ncbi:MAG: hypothetical protein RLZZ612_1861 [Pseudomonadota bacterium]|jgi:hypothetical protein
MMFRLFFVIASAAALAFPLSVMAENSAKSLAKKPSVNTAPHAAVPASAIIPPCPLPEDIESKHLLGTWRVTQPQHPDVSAVLELTRHPEHEDSVRGVLRPTQGQAPLAVWLVGDIDEGELVMDESSDGQRISAIWTVRPTTDSCGRKWEGERRAAGEDVAEALVMAYIPPPVVPAKTTPRPTPTSAAQREPKARPTTGP